MARRASRSNRSRQRQKLQGESIDLIWIDERPSEEMYSELLARTSATDGHLIVSFTPIGEGAAAGVTYKFLSEPPSDRAEFRIASGEVKHISHAAVKICLILFGRRARSPRRRHPTARQRSGVPA